MLYETLLQGKILLCFVFFGIICGLGLSIKKLVSKLARHNKFVVIMTDFVSMLAFSLIFIYAKIKYAYGQFRLFEMLGFCAGIFLEQFSLNNLVEKFLNMSYTLLTKIFCKLKKSKFFGKIFK